MPRLRLQSQLKNRRAVVRVLGHNLASGCVGLEGKGGDTDKQA